jgi:hypothetical protein
MVEEPAVDMVDDFTQSVKIRSSMPTAISFQRTCRLLEQPPDFWNKRDLWSKALSRGRGSGVHPEGFSSGDSSGDITGTITGTTLKRISYVARQHCRP